jgi:hypothetical protein
MKEELDMQSELEPESFEVNELPTVWSPAQWEVTPEEQAVEDEEQATASMIMNADIPEAILRLLLHETEVEQAFEPPYGYQPQAQGEWDYSLKTYQFKSAIRLVNVERKEGYLSIEYDFGDNGHWVVEIDTDECNIYKV